MNIKPWILAARPKTLWAAVSPVLIGVALAMDDGVFHFPSAFIALIGAVLIQIGTNYANDYFDYLKGADTEERLGPTRATAAGWVQPSHMRNAFILVFVLTAILGSYLIVRSGWPIVIIGALSILFAIIYTAGPFPLGYNGLGDIFVFIFFGPVAVGGTYYVQALDINSTVFLAGIAPGLFSAAILTVNNLRDINQDVKSGKKTLQVRFGRKFGQLEYLLSIAIACLIPALLAFQTSGHFAALLAVPTFMLAIPSLKIIFKEEPSKRYNAVLAQTGKMLLIFSLVFSIGWIL